MAQPKGIFQAVTRQADNGSSPEFYIRDRDQMRGGLHKLAPCTVAAVGGFDSGDATLQFFLAGVWHDTTVNLDNTTRFAILDETVAPTAKKFRWTFASVAAAGANVTIEMATPFELAFESARGTPVAPPL